MLNRKRNTRRSFTIIEVLVGGLILALVSAAGYFSFWILTQSTKIAQNRMMAINLVQKTVEEVQAVARTQFDLLESCSKNPESCGFESDSKISEQFPGFKRKIEIAPVQGNISLKKVEVTVNWTERGKLRKYHYTFFLSRPPQALPGNICGRVINSKTGESVNNVCIRVINKNNPSLRYETVSGKKGCKDDQTCTIGGGCYSFADPQTGYFYLLPSEWNLEANTKSQLKSYYSYYHPSSINVGENEEVRVDITLEPKPTPAYIRGRIIDRDTLVPLPRGYVELYQKGKFYARDWIDSSKGTFEFKVEFDTVEEKCFTLVTGNSHYYWEYPYYRWHCGDFCDPHGWGKNLNYRGWSSAVIKEDGSVVCSNPWFGTESTDRICIEPGDELNLGDIPLKVLPKAILEGHVYDENGNSIKGAIVEIRWPIKWYTVANVTTDMKGHYKSFVPTLQEIFPEQANYYLPVRAKARLNKIGCCNNAQATQWVYTSWKRVGPFYQGGVISYNFTLKFPLDDKCGDIEGRVIDGETLLPLMGVKVNIYGWKTTDGNGKYYFKCPPSKEDYCSIPVGSYWVRAKKAGYYEFYSRGNTWYAYKGKVQVKENQTVTFEDIKLWPIKYGSIKGKVIDAGTHAPIQGAKVELLTYWNSPQPNPIYTNDEGEFLFSKVIETWPPPELVGNSYYNQNPRTHTLRISAGPNYYPKTIANITLKANQELDLEDIELLQKGSL